MHHLPAESSASQVAIIGMSGRFPGAGDIDSFWQNLCGGVNSVCDISSEDLIAAGIDPDSLSDSQYVRSGAFLDDVECFDANFFGISPREAELMDPQHRIMLETAWKAIEDAGYDPARYSGRIGIFASTSASTYLLHNIMSCFSADDVASHPQIFSGNEPDYLTSRVSYKLGLTGPSLTLCTACSSSLVAVHQACQSVLNGECEMAIAGGVSIQVPQRAGYRFRHGGITSPDGQCRPFDASANGTVFGSGAALIVIKRLEAATADNDAIRAIILGSAVNNDGSAKVSYTAPSHQGQMEVIRQALQKSAVPGQSISLIEAHGTGTAMGDPIEVAALASAIGDQNTTAASCALGSVKGNIGHLNRAAGIAGVLKVILALEHRAIPPTLHFEGPNPNIDFRNSPFYVNSELIPWPEHEQPRRAAVSSFGFGGTNAHLIMEEPPRMASSHVANEFPQLLVLSAATPGSLAAIQKDLAAFLENHSDANLADIAFTLQVGRKPFRYRTAIVCQSPADGAMKLRQPSSPVDTQENEGSGLRKLIMMFPDHGHFLPDLGLDLYQSHSAFRTCVDECARLLSFEIDTDLRSVMFPGIRSGDHELDEKMDTESQAATDRSFRLLKIPKISKLASFVFSYSLFSVYQSWGIIPSALMGEGVGEIAAACASGVLPLQFALKLVACHATPDIAKCLSDVSLGAAQIPMISSATGTWFSADQLAQPKTWTGYPQGANVVVKSLPHLLARGSALLIELGAGQTLTRQVHQGYPREQAISIALDEAGGTATSITPALLSSLALLWSQGEPIHWQQFPTDQKRRRVSLPTYVFEQQRYWINAAKTDVQSQTTELQPQRKNPDVAEWFYLPSWKQSIPPTLIDRGPIAGRLNWIVFEDEAGLGLHLAQRLRTSGQDVITVRPGARFAQLSQNQFELNPQIESDYSDLLKDAFAQGFIPDRIIHLWGVTGDLAGGPPALPEGGLLSPEEFDREQNLGFYSLMFIATAFERMQFTGLLRMDVVTSDMMKVTDGDRPAPAKRTSLGCVRVIPQELPNISCRSIDVGRNDLKSLETLAGRILSELLLPEAASVVAWRGKRRWTQCFEPIKVGPKNESYSRLRKQGVYLITGGLGGIGMVQAEYLAKTVQAKLILTGRTAFPREQEWDDWLVAHGTEDPVSRKVLQLQEFQKMGAEVMIDFADVGAIDEMQRLLDVAEKRFGPLNGVFHTAGIFDAQRAFRGLGETNRDDCERRFRPKIGGVHVLEKLLRGRNLDFVLLQSSLSTVLGGLGFIAYAAGNLYMDAFAERQNLEEVPWMSIAWDGWNFADPRLIGSGPAEFASPLYGTVADTAMSPQEGEECINRLLRWESWDTLDGVLVSTTDLQSRIEEWIDLQSLGDRTPGHQPTSFDQLPCSPTPVAASDDVEATITRIFEDLLGIEKIGLNDNFFELGGTSLLGVEVIHHVQTRLGVNASVITMLENPTIASLSQQVSALRWAMTDSNSRYAPAEGYEEGSL